MAPKRKRGNSDRPKRHTPRARATFGKKCSFCGDIISMGLAQHEKICKINCANRRQALEYALKRREQQSGERVGPSHIQSAALSFRPPSPQDQAPSPGPMDTDPPLECLNMGLQLPMRFIYIKHHPHAHKPDEIIPLDSDMPPNSLPAHLLYGSRDVPADRPWAPFRCLADSTFAYRCVSRRMPNNDIDDDLKHLHGEWAENVHLTFRNHRDIEKSLAAARERNVRFRTKRIKIDFRGREFSEKSYDVEVEFRDPWEVIKVSSWLSQEKYLCLDGVINFSNPLYDEPWTGETWHEVDDSLPANDRYPSCYIGAHIWLDKGLVSTKVKMHPILLRGCWIQSATRNGSGNGGATLLGFVKMPPALRNIDPKTLSGASRSEYDRLKRQIYHTVCEVVFASLESRSRNGEAIRFGDGVTRIAYPGILVESMDFEEMAAWLAIRNSRANHPCPKCLVHHDDLHKLSADAEPRTPDCPIREQSSAQSSIFIALEHIVRGALLCPIFGAKQGIHFVIDCIDEDMRSAQRYGDSDPQRTRGAEYKWVKPAEVALPMSTSDVVNINESVVSSGRRMGRGLFTGGY
ncbi:hypothetical protein C8J57DRAFT_1477982 [Mycena rebaudengoi]|nr:hypothetical protein C8J57DRAFT_1477982 [Mycena rebaudengoi]